MTYQPSFVEIFLGFALLCGWVAILNRGRATPTLRALPWAVGTAVVLGQVLAAASLTSALEAPTDAARTLVAVGRWGSVTAVAIGAAIAAWATFHPPADPAP